ncbi:MAG: hypothetical protein ACYS0I_21375, partial [Planctomycetota bacterium]
IIISEIKLMLLRHSTAAEFLRIIAGIVAKSKGRSKNISKEWIACERKMTVVGKKVAAPFRGGSRLLVIRFCLSVLPVARI